MEPVIAPTANDRAIEGLGTPDSAWRNWVRLGSLPEVAPATLVPPGGRAVIVAPHPDDEILGTGGLLARLSDLGREIAIIAVTDGTASHPGSALWPVERLADTRPLETADALQRLRVRYAQLTRLHFADGGGPRFEAALSEALRNHLRAGDVVFGTWRHDGHPDHESVGRAIVRVTAECDLPFVEIPVWTWHWATPEDSRVPWGRARRIALDEATLARKLHAIEAFHSQIEPDGSTGREAILPKHVLERLTRPYEVVLI
jgi:LmbE family N-acetylglucosaminyl deacetylase